MIIENPDAFKSWLTAILEPLCDADPAALAKYVYALVKKEKPVTELRDGMLDQLDVFLQQETKPFVDMLFKSLETMEYLKQPMEKVPSPPPQPELAPDQQENLAPNIKEAVRQEVPPPPPKSPVGGTGGARHRVVVARAAPPAPPAPPAPLPPPPPPPAPHITRHHHEQTLVKVLPLSELLEEPVDQPPRRRERRGDGVYMQMRDKDDRRRRRSRSWERRARPRRHPREQEHAERRSRVMSRSPSPRGRYRNRSPPPPPPPTLHADTPRSRSRSPVPVRDRLRVPRELERDRMSRDRDHRDRLSRSRDRERSRDRSRDRSLSAGPDSRLEHNDGYNKRRCRDFDEKGYCMRGDLCQWDHGADPVVLEDAALALPALPTLPGLPPPVQEYNPLAPDIWCGPNVGPATGPFYGPPHLMPHHHPPRELIPIPRVRGEGPPPRHAAPPHNHFDYTRLGPVRPPPLPANAANCSLEVKKVPRGLNDITHLNNHFCKFGKIVNIQVCYENDPERALITFSTPAEASVAYKSTEAVLNNRFIKVFWHNPEQQMKQENNNIRNRDQNNINNNTTGDRASGQHMTHNKVLVNRGNIRASFDARNIKKEKEQANGNTTSEAVKKEVQTPKPIEKSKQVMEMHKRAQALLETQLQQQLLLIQKLESGNVTGPQRSALLEAINSAQEGIEKLRKELVAYNKTLRQIQVKKPKTREEAQKEILDAELDMFTKQQEGQDVTELAKKIAELRRQMSIQYPPHPSVRRIHSRGGRFNTSSRFRMVNSGKVFVNQVVDHRPRALLISGFEPDDLEAVQAHFGQFGEITGKEVNLSVPELVLQYRARAHAEQAAAKGKHYDDRTLSVTWVTNNKPIGGVPSAATPNGEIHADSKETEASSAMSADALLRFDEEDDDDNEEERSWRR